MIVGHDGIRLRQTKTKTTGREGHTAAPEIRRGGMSVNSEEPVTESRDNPVDRRGTMGMNRVTTADPDLYPVLLIAVTPRLSAGG